MTSPGDSHHHQQQTMMATSPQAKEPISQSHAPHYTTTGPALSPAHAANNVTRHTTAVGGGSSSISSAANQRAALTSGDDMLNQLMTRLNQQHL
jgi:hypothetical protein